MVFLLFRSFDPQPYIGQGEVGERKMKDDGEPKRELDRLGKELVA
jgi:hypothetical protein